MTDKKLNEWIKYAEDEIKNTDNMDSCAIQGIQFIGIMKTIKNIGEELKRARINGKKEPYKRIVYKERRCCL